MSIDWRFLRFPFDDKAWVNKALVGGVLGVVGIIVWPLLLPLWGYCLRIMRHTAQGEPPSLPEWDDWGQLFLDGLKFILVYLVYMLPMFLLMCCAYIAMVGPLALVPFAEDSPALFGSGMIAGYVIAYPLIGVGMLLSLPLMFLIFVAMTRMVAHDSLGSAFQLGEVWQLARKGFRNYLLAFVVLYGVTYIVVMAAMGLGYTIVLLCLLPFLTGAIAWYSSVMIGALFGAAYHHTQVEKPAAE
jgi:hypothetical protein